MNLQGTYTDIVEIGSGGGGTVFRAYHIRMQKYVVLKKIHDNIQNNVDIRGELDILKNLRHSYLPTVLDFIEDNGSIYTVMDYIPGESFESLLNRGVRFTQAQVAKYAMQLGEVLTYLHGQKPAIIHGDIKPANIMLTPEDNICLIDFNISQLQNGAVNRNMGYTPGYASPEQTRIVQAMQQYYANYAQTQTSYTGGNMSGSGTVLLNAQPAQPGMPVNTAGSGTVLLNAQPAQPGMPANTAGNGTVLLDTNAVRAGMPVNSAGSGTVLLDANYAQPAMPYAQIQPPVVKERMDERSDLYSTGATLYALLCGVAPNEEYAKIIPIEDLVENCSEGLANLINKCMSYKPEKRWQSAAEYAKAAVNIAKIDKRYKRLVHRQEFSIIFCIFGIAASIVLAISGRERMGLEKQSVYNQLVEQMAEISVTGDMSQTEEFTDLYEEAVAAFPRQPGAYYQKALFLYNSRQYTELIAFLQKDVLTDDKDFTDAEIGNFYFLLANGFLETDDTEKALAYYKTAVKYNPFECSYYSDYAIALARNGELEEAEKVLNDAIEMGLANDKVLLAKGEILGRQGLISDAASSFAQCVAETKDSYVTLRAYILWGKLYDAQEPSKDILLQKAAVLNEAKDAVAKEDKAVVLEQLAQTYIDLGGLTADKETYLQAIACLQEIADLGWDTFVTHNNIGILYETVGEYTAAGQEFKEMLNVYGEDYRTYKRLAFLELDIQAAKENKNRDYGTFLEYYQNAVALFEESGVRADSDMEMQLLDQAYAQLLEGNWITK